MPLKLSSRAFEDKGAIPKKYSCDGQNVSPPLEWTGVPASAKSLLLTCTDPDAPGGLFHHWAAYDLSPELSRLDEIAAEAHDRRFKQAVNDFGRFGYGGPCPPRRDRPHAYHFRLSALSAPIGPLPPNTRCADVIRKARPLEIESAELVGYYGRAGLFQ